MATFSNFFIAKQPRYRNADILAAANGEACTYQGPGCNGNKATVVFCHLNESFAGKSKARKADDFSGFFGCSNCHKLYDSNEQNYYDRMFYAWRAQNRTLKRLFETGVIK